MESRLKVYRFQEIKAENSRGACWLILDGESMVIRRGICDVNAGKDMFCMQ